MDDFCRYWGFLQPVHHKPLHAGGPQDSARMFRELGLEEKAREWEEKSVSLAAVIERFFRIPEHVLYGQYLYGRGYPVLSEKVDSRAICFASFWGRLAVPMPPGWLPPFLMAFMAFPASIPRCLIACPAYHNRAMWPFLEGYYKRVARVENESALALAVARMVRAALLCGTNKENVRKRAG